MKVYIALAFVVGLVLGGETMKWATDFRAGSLCRDRGYTYGEWSTRDGWVCVTETRTIQIGSGNQASEPRITR